MAQRTLHKSSSPKNPLIFNAREHGCLILHPPNRKEIKRLFSDIERNYVQRFWAHLMCSKSPHSNLPMAVAGTPRLLPLIKPECLFALLQPKEEKVGGRTQYLFKQPFSTLLDGIKRLTPKSVDNAHSRLSAMGMIRLKAFSLLDLEKKMRTFKQLVEEIEKRASGCQPCISFACAALLAMRAKGWIAFSVTASSQTSRMALIAKNEGLQPWADPFIYGGKTIEKLCDRLIPPMRHPVRLRIQRLHHSKAHCAVLCTNMAKIDQFDWDTASQILNLVTSKLKIAISSPALRDHWGTLARNRGFQNQMKRLTPWDTVVPRQKAHVWKESTIGPGQLHHELYPSASDPEHTTIVNLDSTSILLRDPEPAEVLAVCKTVEELYVNAFFSNLALRSPYNHDLPVALEGRSQIRYVHGTVLYKEITGFADITRVAALRELRRYPFEELSAGVLRLNPGTIAEARKVLSKHGIGRMQGFPLDEFVYQSESFATLVTKLESLGTKSGHQTGKALALWALAAFRNKQWVILPDTICRHTGYLLSGKQSMEHARMPDVMIHLEGDLKELYQAVTDVPHQENIKSAYGAVGKGKTLIFCTSIRSAKDLTEPLATRVLQASLAYRYPTGTLVRAKWQELWIANGPSAALLPFAVNDHLGQLNLRAPTDKRLRPWIDFLAAECDHFQVGNLEPIYHAFTHWLKWLAQQEVVPAIDGVTREHISRTAQNSYLNYLASENCLSRHRNLCLSKMKTVFERMVTDRESSDKPFLNPIRWDIDRFGAPRTEHTTGTHRSRLSSLMLDELKAYILTGTQEKGFSWNPSVIGIKCIQFKSADGLVVPCPIMPAIIYLMLTFPLRTHQVRWLDSGELDEMRFDFKAKRFVANSKTPIPGRQAGVIQSTNMFAANCSDELEFLVASNKTVFTQRLKSAFTIPYLPPDVLWVMEQVLLWQSMYGAPPHLVRELQEPVDRVRRNQKVAPYYPEICPLFRSPEQKSFYPPRQPQISYFWGKLCALWDEERGKHINPNTGESEQRPGIPILCKKNLKASKTSKHHFEMHLGVFDLHSLRVAGVSRLLDAGLPLAVVAAVAGHRSLAMTLHYYKADHSVLRISIEKVLRTVKVDDEVQKLADEVMRADHKLWALGTEQGLEKLRRSQENGHFTITLSGICPGASCSTGLASTSPHEPPQTVPGSRCPLCRYFIYGPPFLPGLIYDYNCLLYEIERKAHRQAEIRERLIEAEDSGRTGEAQRLRGEDDRIDLEAGLDMKELARLYQIIDECIAARDGNAKSSSALVLITPNVQRVDAKLEVVPRFEQLTSLVEGSLALPFTHRTAPDFAEVELRDLLLGLLRRNGADCYLAGLSKDKSKSATADLAKIIARLVPDRDQRDALLAGLLELRDFPRVEREIRQQAEQYCSIKRDAHPRGIKSGEPRSSPTSERRGLGVPHG